MLDDVNENHTLNAICPYFTMFPLHFPYSILQKHASHGSWVLDPFCGRGTTNYASRLLGLPSIGIDSSPVAVALSQAKLANTTTEEIIQTAEEIAQKAPHPLDIPVGEFWDWAFHRETLSAICLFREELLRDCRTDARKALRALIMGALHGPLTKTVPSYLSNQCQRTYAPKPRYAVKFWKSRNLLPPAVHILPVIIRRAQRYYAKEKSVATGTILRGNSQDTKVISQLYGKPQISWVITSPPYYGMSTYIPDQWLRMWFVGGKATVDYSTDGQVSHSSPVNFAHDLKQVWLNIATLCQTHAQMVVRFGGINDRKVDPLHIIQQSFQDTKWVIQEIKSAGYSSEGRRQALHMGPNKKPLEEYDIWTTLLA